MTADVFLAAFLGCLFAQATLAIAIKQYLGWRLRSAMRKAYVGSPVDGALAMPGPRVATAHCSECHATQQITDDVAGVSMLNGLGWRRDDFALFCPKCSSNRIGTREIEERQKPEPVRLAMGHGTVECESCGGRQTFDIGVPVAQSKAKLRAEGWALGECACPRCASATQATAAPDVVA